ncbi:MAG TPA: hypothetical protein VFG10_03535 [Saprospiraceae bacterium]|nr:hypothetical protein [Saprospiraceae bacterium]
MKNYQFIQQLLIFIICCSSTAIITAQREPIQYFRHWDQRGINMFEPSKDSEQPEFDSLKIRLGACFTQNYQAFTHSNAAIYFPESQSNLVNKNLLFGAGTGGDTTSAKLTGFSTAMANLNLDVQLADGIRLSVETYMSTRHHPEMWVKGGYLQIDKLPMLGNPEWFTNHIRLKMGEFTPNYGDMHMRRSDAGRCIYNPFVENYILDAWTTEIGGELYIFPVNGLMLMAGATNGSIHGTVQPYPETPAPGFTTPDEKKPSIFFKAAYDKTFNDLRLRIAVSSYSNAGNVLNSLYLGDRGGSHYSMVMEQSRSLLLIDGIPSGIAPSTPENNKDSGRFLPLFNNKVSSLMINPFIQWKGLEFFGTFEKAKGRMNFEPVGTEREFTQMAAELVYRFLPQQQLYVGMRYNTLTGRPVFHQSDVTVNRITAAAGWFPTRNILIKLEYVTQEYLDFTPFDYQFDGKFDGFTAQAVVSF